MDMKVLITFRTLCQTLNYQKAADQLQYAPSTLCKHIQLLEQELRVPLFCKQGRILKLTTEGQAFREHAERILESYYQALDSVAACRTLEGSLTIGGCEINTANSLLNLLTQFSQKHAKVHMSMMTLPNAKVPMLVRNGMIDMGYVYSTDERSYPGLETVCLYEEPVYLAAAQDNPIVARRNLHYEDLEGMGFVYPHDTCCFVTGLLQRLNARDVSLGEFSYLGSVQMVAEQVCSRGMLTMVPAGALERYADIYGLARLDMAEEPIWGRESIVYQNYEAMSPLARELVRDSLHYAKRRLEEGRQTMVRLPRQAVI